jgi:hypothetical protein
LIVDYLLQALDAVLGEGGEAVLADAIGVQTSLLGEPMDRKRAQRSPSFYLEQFQVGWPMHRLTAAS